MKVRVYCLVHIILVAIIAIFAHISIIHTPYNLWNATPFYLFTNGYLGYSLAIPFLLVLFFTNLLLLKSKFILIFDLLVLGYLILVEPINIFYFKTYNDQLLFALETFTAINRGYTYPIQGDLTTLGHAYFFSTLSIVASFDFMQTVGVVSQLLLNMIPLLLIISLALSRVRDKSNLYASMLPLFFLSSVLVPFFYGRDSAGTLLASITMVTLSMLMVRRQKNYLVLFFISFIALCITYPGFSLIIGLFPLFLLLTYYMLKRAFDIRESLQKKFLGLTILMLTIFLATQTIPYNPVSNLITTIVSTVKSIVLYPEETTLRISIGATNIIGKYYEDLVRLNILLSYFLAIVLSLQLLFKHREQSLLRLIPMALFSDIIVFQLMALVWWNTRPYFFFSMAFPMVYAYVINNISYQKAEYPKSRVICAILIVIITAGILLTPIDKWGPSPRFYPTERDVLLAEFISNHSMYDESVAAPGSHSLLLFYSGLYGKNLNNIPEDFREVRDFVVLKQLISSSSLEKYQLFAFFYMGVTSGLLYYPKSEILYSLQSIFAESNEKYNLIYSSGGLWRCYEL